MMSFSSEVCGRSTAFTCAPVLSRIPVITDPLTPIIFGRSSALIRRRVKNDRLPSLRGAASNGIKYKVITFEISIMGREKQFCVNEQYLRATPSQSHCWHQRTVRPQGLHLATRPTAGLFHRSPDQTSETRNSSFVLGIFHFSWPDRLKSV